MESDPDETGKTYKPSKSMILEKLRESIMSEKIESKSVEELAKNVDNPDDAAELIKKIIKIIKSKKNNILMLTYQQGEIFRRFETNNKFTSAVSEFKISKTTINFKINIVKSIDKYPKMRTRCISLLYLKNKFRVIKEVCQERASKFQYFLGKFWFTAKQRYDLSLYLKNKLLKAFHS